MTDFGGLWLKNKFQYFKSRFGPFNYIKSYIFYFKKVVHNVMGETYSTSKRAKLH